MDAQDFREMVQRCLELVQVAVREDVKDQLRVWAEDFESEAEAIESSLKGQRARADDEPR